MIIPNIENMSGGEFRESHFKLHYPDFYKYIISNFPEDIKFHEKLYWYYNNLSDKPVCKVCGNPVVFENIKKGYRLYCSRKCMNGDPDKISQVKHTNIEKYGGVVPICSENVKRKIKRTNLERYGVENVMQNPQSHTINTSPEPRVKHKNTYLPQIPEFEEEDTSIELFVQNILNRYNIYYIKNDRNVLNGRELDIYIPTYNIAIECNGIYSHSPKYRDSKYHYNKYSDCLEKGIQLITLWEDQIKNKPDIVESLLLSKLGIFNERIGARECVIKEVDYKTCNNFLNENHIQGACQSKIRLGLYYKDKLVSVMTFGNPIGCSGNKNNKAHILKRFCSLKHLQIIGGANKLLSYYINTYQPDIIESFACNDISNGNVYEKLGFTKLQHNSSYWYIKNMRRYHRSTFTKASIVRMGYKDKVDSSWTEREVMKELGYYRIYDCEQTKYSLKCN